MKNLFRILFITSCALAFAACSDNDEPDMPNPDQPSVAEGAFILCQGTYNLQIEGCLTLIDYATSTAHQNVFQNANGRSLGDTPQAAVAYGSKIYIAVYGSNVIQVIDRQTYKSVKMLSLDKEEGQSPRSLVAKDGKIYASMFNGYVSRLDTASLAIDKTVKVGPNPEIIAILGNYLYVPNSDGMNWQNGYGTTASRIDLSTFTVDKTFTVGLNPGQFASNGTDLFLLCKGNYADVPSAVYRVKNDKDLEKIADATLFAVKDNKLYYINAPWDATEYQYGLYNIKTGEKSAMISDKGVDSPAAIGVDPIDGKIIISSYNLDNGWTSYTTDGYVNVYDANGAFLKKYDTGVGPCAIFFNSK